MAIIEVWFATSGFPTKGRKFVTDASHGELGPDFAVMSYYDGFTHYFAEENQEIYLIKIDQNNWEIKFCDILFDFNGNKISADANFNFQVD